MHLRLRCIYLSDCLIYRISLSWHPCTKPNPYINTRLHSLVVLEGSSYQHPTTTHPKTHHLLMQSCIFTSQDPRLTATCPLFVSAESIFIPYPHLMFLVSSMHCAHREQYSGSWCIATERRLVWRPMEMDSKGRPHYGRGRRWHCQL